MTTARTLLKLIGYCLLLLPLSCRRAPEEPIEAGALEGAWGSPPAAFQGLVFHAPYEHTRRELLLRYGAEIDEPTANEIVIEDEFWGAPGKATIRFLNNSTRALESVRVMVASPLKQVVKRVEPELELCTPYVRKKLRHGVAYLWSDSTRVIFTVKIKAIDLKTTEIAYIDSRPYWIDPPEDAYDGFRGTPVEEDPLREHDPWEDVGAEEERSERAPDEDYEQD